MVVILSLILAIIFIDLAINPAQKIFGFNLLPGGYKDIINNLSIIAGLLTLSLLAGSLPVLMYITKDISISTESSQKLS